jgi:hypothetical protein
MQFLTAPTQNTVWTRITYPGYCVDLPGSLNKSSMARVGYLYHSTVQVAYNLGPQGLAYSSLHQPTYSSLRGCINGHKKGGVQPDKASSGWITF